MSLLVFVAIVIVVLILVLIAIQKTAPLLGAADARLVALLEILAIVIAILVILDHAGLVKV